MRAFFILAAVSAKSVPSMPNQYSMTIEWDMEQAGKTYSFVHNRAYDLENQLYRDDQVTDGKVVSTTIYRPHDAIAVTYDATADRCTSWEFTSRVDGFPPTAGFAFNQTTKSGDEFSKTYLDNSGEFLYRLDVTFEKDVPVSFHNTDDEKAIKDGVKHISAFKTKVDTKVFDLVKEWNCVKPKPAAMELMAKVETKQVPTMPSEYSMTIEWETKQNYMTYTYVHKRSYDLENQLYRDDQVTNGKVVSTTLYRPHDGMAVIYDAIADSCTSWEFTSRIDGFPPTAGFAFNQTTKSGDEFSKTYLDNNGKFLYRLDVTFEKDAPVSFHNTDDETHNGGTIKDGVKHISDFKTKVDAKVFELNEDWKCSKPAPKIMVV